MKTNLRIIGLLAGLAFMIFFWLYIFFVVITPPPEPYKHVYSPAESEWIAKRHAYHGIERSWRDESGYWFVDKNKETCRL